MSFGFMGKLLRINLTTGDIREEEIPDEWNRKFLGGAGTASKYLFEEVPPETDPLGPDNKLIFMSGSLPVFEDVGATRRNPVF